VTNGRASYTTSTLAVATHTIYAMYSGNDVFATASSSMTETIKAATPGNVTGSGNVGGGKQSLQLQVLASVAGSVPQYSGSLTFTDTTTSSVFTARSITSVQISNRTRRRERPRPTATSS